MVDIRLEELKDCLTEEGFTIFGHGTGFNNIEAVSLIFKNGLRASHTSMLYTTIGLDVDANLIEFKEKLDQWPHLDSENIILIKLPNEFFNVIGDSMDLNCEKTGAFVNEKIDEKGNITYYLDPKFIIGAYNRNLSKVILNPNYESKLSESSLIEIKEKLLIAIAKTQEKNKRMDEHLLHLISSNDGLVDLDWNDEEEYTNKL